MRYFLFAVATLLAISSGSSAAPVRWEVGSGGNGHLYEAILVPEHITWTAANAAAQARGDAWHLATITSASENAFVYALVDDPAFWNCCQTGNSGGPWLGGIKTGAGVADYSWVTGEPLMYTNWGTGEPNGNGNRIAFFGYQTLMSPRWNDMPDDIGPFLPVSGYVVERDTNAVPEPSIMMMTVIGFLVIRVLRGR